MDIVLRDRLSRIVVIIIMVFIAPPSIAQEALPVTVMPVVEVSIAEEIALTGDLLARRVSMLSSEVDGIIKGIYIDDGSVVHTDQVIADLDTDIAQINRDTAAAELAEAHATLAESKRRHGELAKLKTQNHTSKTSVAAAQAQIAIDNAARARAVSQLKRATTLLEKHQITAPFSGIANRKLVEVGQWIDTKTALIELVDTDLLRLEIPVPQFYFAAVNQNTPVQIRFDALPDKILESSVTAIIPISNSASRTFRVRIDIPNAEHQLAPGMTAKAIFRLGNGRSNGQGNDMANGGPSESIVAPRDAIVRKPNNELALWLVENEDGISKVKKVIVETGRSYRGGVEILSGNVPKGSLTVVRGNEILRAGQSVHIAHELPAEY